MKLLKITALAVCVPALAATLFAAGRPYETIMKETQAACGNLKKNLDGKMASAANKDARTLQGLYKEIAAFWKEKKVKDAVAIAKQGQTGLKAIASATKANNIEGAQAPFQSLLGTCKSCHAAHREKGADGKPKIKI